MRRLPDVKHASFEVRSGEVLGIGGLVGAGRSELAKAICGLYPKKAGEVIFKNFAEIMLIEPFAIKLRKIIIIKRIGETQA